MSDWRKSIERLIRVRGTDMANLSRNAGLGATFVRDVLKRGHDPKVSNLEKVAGVLGVSVATLLSDDANATLRIPVIGAVSAGEGWVPIDDGLGQIEMTAEGGEPVGLEVRGDSMSPVYRPGDHLIGVKKFSRELNGLVGSDCIVLTVDGERYVKILARGASAGRFNLKSYNPMHDDILDQRLEWAAPIIWVRRGQDRR